MGIGKSSSQQQPASTQTVRTENTIPEYFKPFLERTLQRGEDISNLPYQQYEGDRIAGFQPLQQQALDLTQQQVGNYQSNLAQANTMAGRAGQALTDVDMSAYMNPYQQNVIDIAKREATRQNDIAGLGRDYKAQQAGAFGGSRHGVLDAEANRTLQQQLSDIQMQGSQAAYDRGVSAFQADRTAAGQTGQLQSALAQATQALGKGDVSALSAMGGQQQAQQQSVLDQAAADFYAQRDAPKSELEWYSGILRGYQPQANVNEQRQTAAAAPSVLGQLGSLGAAGLGMTNFSKGFSAAEGGRVPAPEEFAEGGRIPMPFAGRRPARMAPVVGLEDASLVDPNEGIYGPDSVLPPTEADLMDWAKGSSNTSRRAAQDESVLPGATPKPAPKAAPKTPPLSQPKSVLPGRADSRIPDPTDMGITSALPRSETVAAPAPEVKAVDVKKAKEAGWSDEDIGLALMAAGFAGLSSGSPTALGALGAAGQAGVSQLGEIKKGKREQRKLDLEEKLGERKLAAEERDVARKEKADELSAKLSQAKIDLEAAKTPAEISLYEARAKAFLSEMEKVDPARAALLRAQAEKTRAETGMLSEQPTKSELKQIDFAQRMTTNEMTMLGNLIKSPEYQMAPPEMQEKMVANAKALARRSAIDAAKLAGLTVPEGYDTIPESSRPRGRVDASGKFTK